MTCGCYELGCPVDYCFGLGDDEFVGQVEVESKWPGGYGRMTVAPFPSEWPKVAISDPMSVRPPTWTKYRNVKEWACNFTT